MPTLVCSFDGSVWLMISALDCSISEGTFVIRKEKIAESINQNY